MAAPDVWIRRAVKPEKSRGDGVLTCASAAVIDAAIVALRKSRRSSMAPRRIVRLRAPHHDLN
jgi:hypothetical protein